MAWTVHEGHGCVGDMIGEEELDLVSGSCEVNGEDGCNLFCLPPSGHG